MPSRVLILFVPVVGEQVGVNGVADLAFERACLASHNWTDVAAATGCANKAAAMAVSVYLQNTGLEQAPDQRRAALQTELDRIDAPAARLLGKALDGDHEAALVVLKILALRIKILGLERPAAQITQQRTLVISGSPEQYVELPRLIVENDREAQARFWQE